MKSCEICKHFIQCLKEPWERCHGKCGLISYPKSLTEDDARDREITACRHADKENNCRRFE